MVIYPLIGVTEYVCCFSPQGEKAMQRTQGGSKTEGISISENFQEKKSLPACSSHELPSEC